MKLKFLAVITVLSATAPLFGQGAVNILYPSADNRVLDTDADGRGNASHGADDAVNTLNIGDNETNNEWRSVVKFDLRGEEAQIRTAARVILQFTVKNRTLKVPREWKLEVVQIKSGSAAMIDIDPSGESDDYSSKGKVLFTEAGGTIKPGALIKFAVTEEVKAALASGLFAVRLQLQPGTNKDGSADQVAVLAGSHEVNAEHLRPQLQIEL